MKAPKHKRINLYRKTGDIEYRVITSSVESRGSGVESFIGALLFLIVFIGGLMATSAIGDGLDTDVERKRIHVRQELSPVSVKGPAALPAVPYDRDHVLWMARAIASETRDLEQAEAIGWIIYWRWRTEYRGAQSLWSVIHDPWQFSAWADPKLRKRYGALNFSTNDKVWQAILVISKDILSTPAGQEQYGPSYLHFHHDTVDPNWAKPEPDVLIETPNYPDLLIYAGVQ